MLPSKDFNKSHETPKFNIQHAKNFQTSIQTYRKSQTKPAVNQSKSKEILSKFKNNSLVELSPYSPYPQEYQQTNYQVCSLTCGWLGGKPLHHFTMQWLQLQT